MRGAQSSFNRGTGFRREDVVKRRLEIVDQDLMEEDVGGVDEGGVEVLLHQTMGAIDDFRVRKVLRRKDRGLRAKFDLLSNYGGAQSLVVDGVGAAERVEQRGSERFKIFEGVA